jgi:hypothetical protein
MKLKVAIRGCACVLALQLASQAALAGNGPDRPRTLTQSNTGAQTHSKASSFAPQSHSKSHVYGAPIQQPILRHRKPALKVTKPPTPAAK